MRNANKYLRRITPVATELLHEKVAARLRSMIIDEVLPPLMRVPEKELCQQLGISRTPLREALKILASEGLVELTPNRGATITDPTPELLAEKFEAVSALEGLAARLVCKRAKKSQIDKLKSKNDEMIKFFNENDVPRYFRCNIEFHQLLVSFCGNPTVIEMHGKTLMHLVRARFRSKLAAQLKRNYIDEHIELMEAILSRDPDEAERLAREHNEHIADRVLSLAARDSVNQPDAAVS
ncbi:MAG: GntR family transcriptional regulator [Salinarimonadaceae bacterium]|nr:MAG: GntR family transcriptional regulator [Salinarimonadaceae bacterium]